MPIIVRIVLVITIAVVTKIARSYRNRNTQAKMTANFSRVNGDNPLFD